MFINGNIGPNISSCITGSVGLTSMSIVGEIYLSRASQSPPIATLPLFKYFTRRLLKVYDYVKLKDI